MAGANGRGEQRRGLGIEGKRDTRAGNHHTPFSCALFQSVSQCHCSGDFHLHHARAAMLQVIAWAVHGQTFVILCPSV